MGAKAKPKRTRAEPRLPAPGVCIAGMHRSGTSMIAHALFECGLCLGDPSEMLPPSPTNPDGYWENTAFVTLNEELLKANAAQWDDPPESGLGVNQETLPFRDEAEALIRTLAAQGVWGWKDPRNSLTVPFWRAVAPELTFVVCLRNPLEVALSLATRNGMSYESALDLWYRYNECLIRTTTASQRIVVHYVQFLSNPLSELERLCAFVNLTPTADQKARAVSVVRNSARHYRLGLQHLLAADVSPPIVSLYATMCAEARYDLAGMELDTAEAVPADPTVHTSAPLRQRAVIEVEALRHRLTASQADQSALGERLRALSLESQVQVEQLKELGAQLEEAQSARSALACAAKERDAALGELRVISSESVSVRRKLESSQAEAGELRSELESTKTEANQSRRELRAASSIAELQALRAQDLASQVAALRAELAEVRGERARHIERANDLTLEVRRLEAAVSDLRVADARKEAQTRQRDSHIVNLKRTLTAKDDDILRSKELLAIERGKVAAVEHELANRVLELQALEERARTSERTVSSELGQLRATIGDLQGPPAVTRDRLTRRRFNLSGSMAEAREHFRIAMDLLFGRTYRATLEPLAELERVPGQNSRWFSLGVDPCFDVLPPLPSGLTTVSITGSSTPESAVTLYVDEGSGFTESAAHRLGALSPDERTLSSEITLRRPRRMRLDPMDQPGVCEVRELVFRVPHGGSRIVRALRVLHPRRRAQVP